ncbi:MAG: zf-HC2 domain-containing protein [Planctomycetota bacterium]
MTCAEIRHLLDEYVDGELSAEREAAVDRHLAECPTCRAELEAVERTAELVRSLPREPAPPGLAEAVAARVRRSARRRRRAAALRWIGVGGWLAAAATLIVVIKTGSGPPEPGRTAERTKVTAVRRRARPAAEDPAAPGTLDEVAEREDDRAEGGRRAAEREAHDRRRRTGAVKREQARKEAFRKDKTAERPAGAGGGRKAVESYKGAAADAREKPRAAPLAPDALKKRKMETREAEEPAPNAALRTTGVAAARRPGEEAAELTMVCESREAGLAAVRRIVAAIPGAALQAEGRRDGEDGAAPAVAVTLPGERVADLRAELAKAASGRPKAPAEAKVDGAVERGATAAPADAAEEEGSKALAAEKGAREAVTVLIRLQVAPAEEPAD